MFLRPTQGTLQGPVLLESLAAARGGACMAGARLRAPRQAERRESGKGEFQSSPGTGLRLSVTRPPCGLSLPAGSGTFMLFSCSAEA